MAAIDPINREINRVNQVIADLTSTVVKTLNPVQKVRSRRQKRFIWTLLRTLIPDGRFEAIDVAVRQLASQQVDLAKMQKTLASQMVSISESVDKRVTGIRDFFLNQTQGINGQLLILTKEFETQQERSRSMERTIMLKLDSLARIIAILGQQLTNLNKMSLALSDFKLAIESLNRKHLSPILVPPEVLSSYLNSAASLLSQTDYELLYPASSLHHYYNPSMAMSAHPSDDGQFIVLVVPIPTRVKTYSRQVVSVSSFDYPFDVVTSGEVQPGLMRISSGVTQFVITTEHQDSPVETAITIARVPDGTEVTRLTTGSLTASGLFWSKPEDHEPNNCQSFLFSRWLSSRPITTADKDTLASLCVATLRRVTRVTAFRIMSSLWHVVVPRNQTVQIALSGASDSAGTFGEKKTVYVDPGNVQKCQSGCVIRVPCGFGLRIIERSSTFTTSTEQSDCSYTPTERMDIDIQISTYYTDLAKLIVPTIKSDTPRDNSQVLSELRKNLQVTAEKVQTFIKTDNEISLTIKNAISDLTEMKHSIASLKESIRITNKKMIDDIEKANKGATVCKILNMVLIVLSVGLGIFLIFKFCGPRIATAMATAKYTPIANAQFVLDPDSEPLSVVIKNSVLNNPDLWGLLIGLGILVVIVIVWAIVYWKIRNHLREYSSPPLSSIMFSHLGPIINHNLPSLAGYSFPNIHQVPRVINTSMKYPPIQDPRCLVMVWVKYNIKAVGDISFMTGVGSIDCVDRDKITSVDMVSPIIKMVSPGSSTILKGTIGEIIFKTDHNLIRFSNILITLSIPPSIQMARFRVCGVALCCARCGDSWIAITQPSAPSQEDRPQSLLIVHSDSSSEK